nr:hypothetical protein [Tanacetum cinerariifolium]
MRELREDTFSENKNKDAHDHIDRVLNKWVDRLTPGAINTWDLLKKAFIQRNISSNSNTDGLAAIISKLDNLGRGPHLDKECPLNEDFKQVREVKYGEFGRPAPFNGSNGAKFCVGPPRCYTRTDNRSPYGEKRPSLEELINKNHEEST